MTILGIGYGNARTFAELLDRIQARRITHVVDVRAAPMSMGRPWLHGTALRRQCCLTDVQYRHDRRLGNPFYKAPNGLDLYRVHLDELADAGARSMLRMLAVSMGGFRAALLCGCKVEAKCHRSVLLDYLGGHGFEVEREI